MFCLYQLANGSHTKKIMDVLNKFWEHRNSVCIFPNKIWEARFTHGATSPKKNEDAENHGRFPSKNTILGLLVLTFQGCKRFCDMFMLPVTEDLVKL